MTTFSQLKRDCMDHYADSIIPWLKDGREGHMWTGRHELAGIIERIEDWLAQPGCDLIERGEATKLLEFFKSLPDAKYTIEQCSAELKRLTMIWTGGKGHL